jgi:tetratricopeptide (TPR) repeat protein/predicted Ser/Thr protein kinase
MHDPASSDSGALDPSTDATLPGALDPESATHTPASTIGPGSVVGRHVVLHRLGAGAMGVVYAAYDPELDRKVALKLMLPGMGGPTGRLRLLREAQALAKLSHPNVVTIHDVGTVAEHVWIAMEFVQGQTLGEWSKARRDWRAVLEIMGKAGAGLAAAHAAGLLHRDFKPDNVMVGDDGRVCVMDFGLARMRVGTGACTPELDPSRPSAEAIGALATSVTQAGAVVGTPSYMAPEQFHGAELTGAADQFAFCVTLWGALYGERPFAGSTIPELVTNVLEGTLRSPPRDRPVPGWLRRVCERGLSVEPAQRWPSMHELLDSLAKGHTRARVRKGLVAVAVLGLLGVGVDGARRYDLERRTAACEATGAQVETAWSPERERALREALVATGVSYAATTADKTMPWLDRRADAWRDARVEVCLDAEVRGRMDAEMLDRSLWCLDERRMELESLVDELTLADAEVLHKTVTAAAELSSVAPCRDERVLHALSPPPDEDREAVRAVRAEVARAGSLERSGRYDKGLEVIRGVFERAEALGWRPLTAVAGLRLGTLLERTGAYAESERALEGAYFEAANGAAPEVAFEAAAELVFVVGVDSARYDDGLRWSRLAEVALVDIPDDEHLRRAGLLAYLAATHTTHDRDAAKALAERALALFEGGLGPEHPHVAMALANLGNIHASSGAYHEARELYERALVVYEGALGPEHPDVATALNNLAVTYANADDLAETKRLQERALAIYEGALGPEHPDVATALNNLASTCRIVGAYDEARRLGERALAIRREALGAEHPLVASSLRTLASIDYETGAYDEAMHRYTQALAIDEKALGPEHAGLAASLTGLASLALRQGRPTDAVPLARRAVAVLEKNGAASGDLAVARFALAEALWDAPADGGRDRARAVSLVEGIRQTDPSAGSAHARRRTKAEAWLAAHRDQPDPQGRPDPTR